MIIDGKKLSNGIQNLLREEILKSGLLVRLAVIQVGNDPVTEKFLEQKKKFGADIGVAVDICNFPKATSTDEIIKKISEVARQADVGGIIVQLPLPSNINTNEVLDTIPFNKDPDTLSSKSTELLASGSRNILPPVVGAVRHIMETYHIALSGKQAVVIGRGRLVGLPVALWLTGQGATVTTLDKYTEHVQDFTLSADIIVSGAGKGGLITSDMVHEGTVVIDCGSSELYGHIVGDVEKTVAEKAAFFSPVPGGVGPLTVAMLFSNVLALVKKS